MRNVVRQMKLKADERPPLWSLRENYEIQDHIHSAMMGRFDMFSLRHIDIYGDHYATTSVVEYPRNWVLA